MEITNNSRYYSIPLVVGRRIAQIVFFDTDGTLSNASYEKSGKYQTSASIDQLISNWQPSAMLPRMFQDREITNGPAVDILRDDPEILNNNPQYIAVRKLNNLN
jgi:hypothetical protein